jgi:hypothetical protein
MNRPRSNQPRQNDNASVGPHLNSAAQSEAYRYEAPFFAPTGGIFQPGPTAWKGVRGMRAVPARSAGEHS